jgi:hypothetical protein
MFMPLYPLQMLECRWHEGWASDADGTTASKQAAVAGLHSINIDVKHSSLYQGLLHYAVAGSSPTYKDMLKRHSRRESNGEDSLSGTNGMDPP